MDRLEYVAKALLVYETLDAEQFVKAFNKELPLEVLDTKKDVHWLGFIEEKLSILGNVRGLNTTLTLILLFISQSFVTKENQYEVIIAGIWGIIIYLLVDGISHALEKHNEKQEKIKEITGSCFANSCFVNS